MMAKLVLVMLVMTTMTAMMFCMVARDQVMANQWPSSESHAPGHVRNDWVIDL